MLALKHVSRTFRTPSGELLPILRDISFEIAPGDVVAIQGRSGSGKSTLLNLIGLLDLPTEGTVSLAGRDTTAMTDRERARLRGEAIGFVFQQFHLLQGRSARANVEEPLLFGTALERRDRTLRATDLLKRVGLQERLQATPSVLSGGEQQRVAIARALARRPGLLLADEPTGSLDVTTGDQVSELLVDLAQSEGTTLVFVTHDDRVAQLARRRLMLEDGAIREVTGS